MPANIAGLNNSFIRAEQFVHQAIANKSKDTMSIWRDMIELGNFEYGRGYMMKKHSFYGGKEVTDSTGDWYQLKDYNDRSDSNDHLENACQYEPVVTDYGFEEKKYTIYETTRKTKDICLRDIVFHYQFEQQLQLIFDNLSDITLGAWEKWLRETYVTFATKQIVAEGFPTFEVDGASSGDVIDQAGLREIKLEGVPEDTIGVLSQDVLDYHYQYLARQARGGKVADGENGMPVFALVTSFETSTELISKDSVRNQDMRYARPSFLLEGYGTITGYKNFAHSHDLETPRFKVSETAGQLTRVFPYEFTPTTIGNATNISRDYVTAPFELSIIFLKNVYKGLVPENPTAVSGATFGGASNLGTYKWINIEDKDTNLLGETGFMFARFNCAPEPLEQVDNALVLLHRRHQAVPVVMPKEGAELSTAGAGPVDVLSVEHKVTPEDSSSVLYREIEVVLGTPLTDRIGDDVVVAITGGSNSGNKDARIARDYANGRYRLIMDADSDWVSDISTGGASATVAVGTPGA